MGRRTKDDSILRSCAEDDSFYIYSRTKELLEDFRVQIDNEIHELMARDSEEKTDEDEQRQEQLTAVWLRLLKKRKEFYEHEDGEALDETQSCVDGNGGHT